MQLHREEREGRKGKFLAIKGLRINPTALQLASDSAIGGLELCCFQTKKLRVLGALRGEELHSYG